MLLLVWAVCCGGLFVAADCFKDTPKQDVFASGRVRQADAEISVMKRDVALLTDSGNKQHGTAQRQRGEAPVVRRQTEGGKTWAGAFTVVSVGRKDEDWLPSTSHWALGHSSCPGGLVPGLGDEGSRVVA